MTTPGRGIAAIPWHLCLPVAFTIAIEVSQPLHPLLYAKKSQHYGYGGIQPGISPSLRDVDDAANDVLEGRFQSAFRAVSESERSTKREQMDQFSATLPELTAKMIIPAVPPHQPSAPEITSSELAFAWNTFKQANGKNYSSPEEEAMRMRFFESTLKQLMSLAPSKNITDASATVTRGSYQLDVNGLSDLLMAAICGSQEAVMHLPKHIIQAPEEYSKRCGTRLPKSRSSKRTRVKRWSLEEPKCGSVYHGHPNRLRSGPLPETFDLYGKFRREYGGKMFVYVKLRIKDQTTAMHMAMDQLSSRNQNWVTGFEEGSVEEIIYCNDRQEPCESGWPEDAMDYIIKHEPPAARPSVAEVETSKYGMAGDSFILQTERRSINCAQLFKLRRNIKLPNGSAANDDTLCFSYVSVTNPNGVPTVPTNPNGAEELLKRIVATVGPVVVAVHSDSFAFKNYKKGVYANDKDCTKEVDHALLVVGWGTDAETGMDYWLLQNSWGVYWGEDGFMKLARNRQNYCNISTYQFYMYAHDCPSDVTGVACGFSKGIHRPIDNKIEMANIFG